MNDDNPVWPPIETPEKLLREIGPVGTPAPDRTAELAAALALVTKERDALRSERAALYRPDPLTTVSGLTEKLGHALAEVDYLKGEVAACEAAEKMNGDKLATVTAERDALRDDNDRLRAYPARATAETVLALVAERAETLRRVRVALDAFGVADCDDPIDALEALAADVSRHDREATEEHNAAVRGAHADGWAEGLEKALAVLDTLGVGQDVLRRVESEVSRG